MTALEQPIPALRPPSSPQELRDSMVEDFMVMNRSMGLPDDRPTVERQALTYLHVHDAVQREAPAPPPPPTREERAAAERDRAKRLDERAAERHQAHIMRGHERVVSTKNAVMHAKTLPTDRWSYAKARIARICEGVINHPDIVKATAGCTMPKLAREVFRIQGFVLTRHTPPNQMPPGSERNPFFGMSEADYAAKFRRLIEDICDRSTGRLGSWYVK